MAKLVLAFVLLYVICILHVKSEAKPFFFDLLSDIFDDSGRGRGHYNYRPSGRRWGGSYNNYNYRPAGRRYYSNNGYNNNGYSNSNSNTYSNDNSYSYNSNSFTTPSYDSFTTPRPFTFPTYEPISLPNIESYTRPSNFEFKTDIEPVKFSDFDKYFN
jgi:hypothetical protein